MEGHCAEHYEDRSTLKFMSIRYMQLLFWYRDESIITDITDIILYVCSIGNFFLRKCLML
jgi:hypothetical protein